MAKKKKKKKPTPPGVDPNERRRERLEARRRAKAEEQARRIKAERRRKLITRTVALAAIGGAVWFLFLRPSGPTSIEGHPIQYFRDFGSFEHTAGPVDYETAPPVSGPHANEWRCGVFSDPLPEENQVHNLEHGSVGILYRPDDVPLEDIRSIEEIVEEEGSHMFSSPYPDMPTAIAVTGWAKMMRLDGFDESAIRKFVDAFKGDGPEDAACDLDVGQPFEPEPSPSPQG